MSCAITAQQMVICTLLTHAFAARRSGDHACTGMAQPHGAMAPGMTSFCRHLPQLLQKPVLHTIPHLSGTGGSLMFF